MKEIFLLFNARNQHSDGIKYNAGVPNLATGFTIKFEPNAKGTDVLNGNSGKINFTILRNKIQSIEIQRSENGKRTWLNFNTEGQFGTEIISFYSDKSNSEQIFTDIKHNLLKFWKLVEENPNAENDIKLIKENRDKETLKTSKGCLIFFGICAGLLLLFWAFGGDKKNNDSLSTTEAISNYDSLAQSNVIEKEKIGKEIEILNQIIIPINSVEDEVKNAYLILNSEKYFIDTEIIRFTALGKKLKGTEFEKRISKTRDSLILNEEKISEKKIKDAEIQFEKDEIKKRKQYGENFRNLLLDKGLNIKVAVSGKNNERIKLTYVLFDEVWFRKFETEGYFDQLHEQGFTKIELSDGYKYGQGVKYER